MDVSCSRKNMNTAYDTAFCKISNLENAVQINLDAEKIINMGKLAGILAKMGYDTLTVSIDENKLVLGKGDIGIVVAGRVEDND